MRFASLGSGSEGNALLVSAGNTCVLMDCGFGLNETMARLARLGILPEQLSGILVTHEHGDHARGVARFARKFGLTVWLTHGTLRSIQPGEFLLQEIDPHAVFAIGDLEITPYPVPHDAAEPVQFVFGDGQRRLGVLTDAGCSTPHIEKTLNGCDALVLECNHDREMLLRGQYPASLKQRVGGRLGHLSNDQAAEILSRIETGSMQHLVAAHLSAQNNQPSLAVAALSQVLGCHADWIDIATQTDGLDWREIV
jgi:phosphoribosyl 1,2-cyclic phosphodiesterase